MRSLFASSHGKNERKNWRESSNRIGPRIQAFNLFLRPRKRESTMSNTRKRDRQRGLVVDFTKNRFHRTYLGGRCERIRTDVVLNRGIALDQVRIAKHDDHGSCWPTTKYFAE